MQGREKNNYVGRGKKEKKRLCKPEAACMKGRCPKEHARGGLTSGP